MNQTFAWDRRHLASAAVLSVFLVFVVGTSKSKPSGPTPTPAPSPAPTPAATLADVDVAKIETELCGAKKTDACRALGEFKGAASFSSWPTAEKSWVGYSYAAGGPGDGKREFAFMKMRPGAASITPPAGTLEAYSAAVRSLKPDNASEAKDAEALVSALSAGKSEPKASKSAEFVRGAAPPNGYDALVKAGRSYVTINSRQEKRYLRVVGNRVLVVESIDSGLLESYALKARAFVYELWPLS